MPQRTVPVTYLTFEPIVHTQSGSRRILYCAFYSMDLSTDRWAAAAAAADDRLVAVSVSRRERARSSNRQEEKTIFHYSLPAARGEPDAV